MSTAAFRELREEIIKLLAEKSGKPIDPPPADSAYNVFDELDTVALSIDSVPVMLTYHQAARDDRAFVFAGFGVVPADLELAALRKLLEINFILYQGNAPTFARDPDSGHIMFLGEIPLAGARADQVLFYMHEVAKQGREWRSNFFLGIPPLAATSGMAGRI